MCPPLFKTRIIPHNGTMGIPNIKGEKFTKVTPKGFEGKWAGFVKL